MGKLDGSTLVVGLAASAFPIAPDAGCGFVPLRNLDPLGNRMEVRPRTEALERDAGWRQFASYCVLIRRNRVWTYSREDGDGRLTGLASIGVGGHVEHRDMLRCQPGSHADWLTTTVYNACIREIEEETGLSLPNVRFRGLILLDGSEVDRVHAGFVATATIGDDREPEPEPGIRSLGWLSVSSLRDMADRGRLESWSRCLVPRLLDWL